MCECVAVDVVIGQRRPSKTSTKADATYPTQKISGQRSSHLYRVNQRRQGDH